ncbi:hypothetical protein AVEN_151389-1 [Araneus ventricosus]|uniref:Uncharacterized protein n=1 Tax=Araneus ventricosus TaxID=182803 RepID=A0A4Y2C914_ARAVE|nr:hypothetical protein AVEN_151389-1 [Araneus ventricosus]
MCKCAVSTLQQTCFAVLAYKCVVSTSQQTCFESGLVDYAVLLCKNFAANLPRQVCYDKVIPRKITLAANVHAVWAGTQSCPSSARGCSIAIRRLFAGSFWCQITCQNITTSVLP